MNDKWHNLSSGAEAGAFSQTFWERHKREMESGEFWADRIKGLRGEPVERLRVAIENLPLPAAFKEAAVATRALIRECRKSKEPYDDQLALLYWLAAVYSFAIPFSSRLGEPGYNVLESVPGEVLKGLEFSYKQLGYEKLELLNKTDIKWLIASWGEPDAHSSLHELHQAVWKKYEDALIKERKEENTKFAKEMEALLREDIEPRPKKSAKALPQKQRKSKKRRRKSNTNWVNIAIAVAFLIYIIWNVVR
ncbi:hypothetical protein [uncultured Spongiibacter sp.]|uniref:hypothetical protein n=2 Tax=Spongiibacter TaxID=630749 RepID=UPI002599932C|nr:hypothetical protein [uncultured Spongiibacter sp.]|tara:strand:- start:3427 stop:4176 length:750 start_codon:yes stop_codon:yes gene_type:complete